MSAATLIRTFIGGCLIGIALSLMAFVWWRQQQQSFWLDDDFIPDGCRTLRTLMLFERTGHPSHEAVVVVCPPEALEALEAGRRLKP